MKTLVTFAKYPAPGKVKTRLGATVGMDVAATLYRHFLQKTMRLAETSRFDRRILYFEPADSRAEFERIAPGFELLAQPAGDLGTRLLHAFASAFATGATGVVVLGSDSPTLPGRLLEAARAALDTHDLVVGPALDGGYYLLGLRQLHADLFKNIRWSTGEVLNSTLARADKLGLSQMALEPWYDVDDLETLRKAARDDASGEIQALVTQYVGGGDAR